eukprot:Sspe_Gene.38574::Locus_18598_Transcript_1_1_Confidence_1.000_Length_1649::g.38574::m.38574
MAAGEVVRATAIAVARVVALLVAGAVMARFRIANKEVWTGLSKLCGDLLVPALVIPSVATAVTVDTVGEIWIVPVVAIIITAIGFLLGAVASLIPQLLPYRYLELAIVCLSFPNAVAIPVPIVHALVKEVDWLSRIDGAKEKGAAYCFVFGAVDLLILWSVGYSMLERKKQRAESLKQVVEGNARSSRTASSSSNGTNTKLETPAPTVITVGARDEAWADQTRPEPSPANPLQPNCHPSSLPNPSLDPEVAERGGVTEQCSKFLASAVNPVTCSVMLGMAIGLVPPIHDVFIDSFVYDILLYIGNPAPPLVLLSMGASMATLSDTRSLPRITLGTVTFLRLVVMAVVGGLVVYGVEHAGLIEDRLLQLCLLLFTVAPMAANISIVANNIGVLQQEIAFVAFAQQICCIGTIAVGLIIHLRLLEPDTLPVGPPVDETEPLSFSPQAMFH